MIDVMLGIWWEWSGHILVASGPWPNVKQDGATSTASAGARHGERRASTVSR